MGSEPSHDPMMTQVSWRLVEALSRMLDADERQAVRGDLAESGVSVGAAVRDLLGLIVRRQAGCWTEWQPWLALFGVSVLVGVPLSRIAFRLNVDISQQLIGYRNGVHFGTGLTVYQDIAFLLCLAVALLVWSWTCGFVLGSLSGRAAWLTWSVFYLTVLDSAWARFVLSGNITLHDPRPLRLLLFTTPNRAERENKRPAILSGSVLLGVRRRVVPLRAAYALASVITILTILTTWMNGWYETAREAWSNGAWPGVSWPLRLLPFVLVNWPVGYLLTIANRHTNERGSP